MSHCPNLILVFNLLAIIIKFIDVNILPTYGECKRIVYFRNINSLKQKT